MNSIRIEWKHACDSVFFEDYKNPVFLKRNIQIFGNKNATSFLNTVRVTGIKHWTRYELNGNMPCDSVFIEDYKNPVFLKTNIQIFGNKNATSFFKHG